MSELSEENGRGLMSLALPLAVVMAPQIALATIQHGVSVLGPEITAGAGLPPQAVGVIGGLSGFGSVWFFAANGAITPVLGPVRTLIVACLTVLIAVAAMMSAWAPLIFLAAPLVGFSYGATAPAGSQILAQATPRKYWSALFSIRMAGVPMGGALAGLIGAGLASAYDWRLGLLALGAIPLICAAFLALAAGPYAGPKPTARVRLAAVLSFGNLAKPFVVIRRTPALFALTVASLGFAAAQSGAFVFLTTYLTDGVGLSLGLAGALYATLQTSSFIGRILMGLIADRLGSPRPVQIVLGLCSAAGSAMLTLASTETPVPLLFIGAAVAGMAIATWNGLFLAQIAAVAGDGDVSEATAASTFFTFLSYMATPPIFAAVALGYGYETAYLAVAACVLLAVVVLVLGGGSAKTAEGRG